MTDEQKPTKSFATADVLGVLTARLLDDISGIERVCHFMCGELVWTHQIPRIIHEIRPVILRQHPELAPVIDEAEAITRQNWCEILAGWVARFGSEIALSPMNADEHESIDPMSELAEKMPPDRIIQVKL